MAKDPGRGAATWHPPQGAGEALHPKTRRSMEQRFGHDFSSVRVHADTSAALSARAMGAAVAPGEQSGFGRVQEFVDRLPAHEADPAGSVVGLGVIPDGEGRRRDG